jgi:preprotein translocase subunit SecB
MGVMVKMFPVEQFPRDSRLNLFVLGAVIAVHHQHWRGATWAFCIAVKACGLHSGQASSPTAVGAFQFKQSSALLFPHVRVNFAVRIIA